MSSPLMPLTFVPPGRTATIRAIHGGRAMRQRLASMGLLPESQIEVLRGNLNGALVVRVKESRLVLGRGMAEKIRVG